MTPTNLNADTQVQDAANNWWNPLGTDTKYELAAKHGLFTDFSSFPERFPEESILSIYLKEVQPPTPSLDWDLYPGNEAGAFDHLDHDPGTFPLDIPGLTAAAAKEEDTVGGEIEKQVYKIDIFQSESILGNDFLKVTDVLKPRFVGGIVYCEGDSITINNMADVAKYNGVGKKKMELKSTLFLSKESLITLLNKL